MVKLPIVSSREVVKALTKLGFVPAPKRGKGSHQAFVKESQGKSRIVIVPQKDDIPRGTLLSILDQAGVTRDDFLSALK